MIERQAGAELPGGRVDRKVAMRIPRGDGIKDVIRMTCGQGNEGRSDDLRTRLTSSAPYRQQQGWAALAAAQSGRKVDSSTGACAGMHRCTLHKCECTHVCKYTCESMH